MEISPVLASLSKAKARSRDCGVLALSTYDRWRPQARASRVLAVADTTEINIYDVIGYDWWTDGGITASWIADQIRGKGDLVININSPGGDFFEGLAIYNLLRGHAGRKTINVVGLAASAASLVMCAGDDIRIAAAGYVMIHNVWGLVVGDKNDMAAAAKDFEKFDQGCRVIYTGQSGKGDDEIVKLMDEETWFLGQEAVDNGFANALLPVDAVEEDKAEARIQAPVMALRKTESILCQKMTRTEARDIINQIKGGKPDAAAPGMHDAADKSAVADGLRSFIQSMRN